MALQAIRENGGIIRTQTSMRRWILSHKNAGYEI
jgi:hypothetical protein